MAEVAASIIGISTFGIKLTLTLYEFGSTTSSAKQQTDHIAKHVTLYSNVLELLAERLESDALIISDAAIDLVQELYDQSDELFNRIKALLPRRDGRDELSFLQKIGWNFKKTKVELKRKGKFGEEKARSDREIVEMQCLKVQNAIVEQVNAAQLLPNLQKEDDRSDTRFLEAGTTSIVGSTKAVELMARQSGVITGFQTSLSSIEDLSQRQAYILRNSTQLLHDLLLQWTNVDTSPDEVPVPTSDAGLSPGMMSDSVEDNRSAIGPEVVPCPTEETNKPGIDQSQLATPSPAKKSVLGLSERRRSPYATSQNGHILPDTGESTVDDGLMHLEATRRRARFEPHTSAGDEEGVTSKSSSHHDLSGSSALLQGRQSTVDAASNPTFSVVENDLELEIDSGQSTVRSTNSKRYPQILDSGSEVRAQLHAMFQEAKNAAQLPDYRVTLEPPRLTDIFSAYSRRSHKRYKLITRQMRLRQLVRPLAVRRFGWSILYDRVRWRREWEMGSCVLEILIPNDRVKHAKLPHYGKNKFDVLRIELCKEVSIYLSLDGHENWYFNQTDQEYNLDVSPDGSEKWKFDEGNIIQGTDREGVLFFWTQNGTIQSLSPDSLFRLDPVGILRSGDEESSYRTYQPAEEGDDDMVRTRKSGSRSRATANARADSKSVKTNMGVPSLNGLLGDSRQKQKKEDRKGYGKPGRRGGMSGVGDRL